MAVASPGAGVTGYARVDGGVDACWVYVCAGWVSTTQPDFLPGMRPGKPIIDGIISLTTNDWPMKLIGCQTCANNPKCMPSPW